MAKDQKKKEKKETKNSFIKDVNSELKKVTWPTAKQLITSTSTVLFITIFLALIVFVLDFAFEKANTYGVEKLKAVVSSSENEEGSENSSDVESDENVTTDNTTTEDSATDNTTADNATEDNATAEDGTASSTEPEAQTTENVQTEEVAQ